MVKSVFIVKLRQGGGRVELGGRKDYYTEQWKLHVHFRGISWSSRWVKVKKKIGGNIREGKLNR